MPLQLDIVTPEKKIFSDLVDNVYLPGADGEMGILPQHAGLVTALKPGELRFLHKGKVETLAIGSGFAEVTQTKVIVLTDSALGEAEIDEDHAEAAIKRAQEKIASIDHNVDFEELAQLQGIIAKSMSDLHFKRKYNR
jgi:F-type H+-transporting ATPase subunit epsilon